jgi:hypothetical protein
MNLASLLTNQIPCEIETTAHRKTGIGLRKESRIRREGTPKLTRFWWQGEPGAQWRWRQHYIPQWETPAKSHNPSWVLKYIEAGQFDSSIPFRRNHWLEQSVETKPKVLPHSRVAPCEEVITSTSQFAPQLDTSYTAHIVTLILVHDMLFILGHFLVIIMLPLRGSYPGASIYGYP